MNTESKTILEMVVGSTVHGVAVQDGLEDLDLMAVVLESPEEAIGFWTKDAWSTRSKPMGVRSEAGDTDYIAYGLRKYLSLALKGNPSVLLALFTPQEAQFTRRLTYEGEELRQLTEDIVSRAVYEPFRGYMRQQNERLLGLRGQRNVTRPELVKSYGYDTKYACQIVRLGFQGAELLRTGRITLPMPLAEREMVLAVRQGKFSLAEVSKELLAAEDRLIEAREASPLNPGPNMKRVEEWMVDTYLTYWEKQSHE